MIEIKGASHSFSKDDLSNKDKFDSFLSEFPTVKKYFSVIFKNWLERLDNPFAILWLRQLLDKKLNYLENLLSNLSLKNKPLIEKIVNELKNTNTSDEAQLISKILSLSGELLTYKYLKENFPKVDPLESIGDFLCEDKILVSVKSKNIPNFNSFLIAEYIHGLLYLNDYSLLNNFDFSFEENDGINDHFRNCIINFIKNDLLALIKELPEPKNEFDINPIMKCYKDNNNLEVNAYKFITQGRKKIEFAFNYQNKIFNMQLGNRLNINLSDLRSFHFYYPESQEYKFEKINNSICNWLKDFDNKLSKTDTASFWGWINIPVNYLTENGFLQDKENVQQQCEQMCKNKNYRVTFCFHPFNINFDLKNAMIFEYNREILCQNKNKV